MAKPKEKNIFIDYDAQKAKFEKTVKKVTRDLKKYMVDKEIHDKIDDSIIGIYASNVARMESMDDQVNDMSIMDKSTLDLVRAKNTLAGTNLRIAKMIGITEYSRKGLSKEFVSDDDDFKEFD